MVNRTLLLEFSFIIIMIIIMIVIIIIMIITIIISCVWLIDYLLSIYFEVLTTVTGDWQHCIAIVERFYSST